MSSAKPPVPPLTTLQLSRLEGKPGTAERPRSDLGAVSFRSYWQRAVLDCLRENTKGDISIQVQQGAGAREAAPVARAHLWSAADAIVGRRAGASKATGSRCVRTAHSTPSAPPPTGPRKQEISEATMMMPQDIMDTLKQLGLLQYWKGTHYIAANPKLVEDYWRQLSGQRSLEVDPRHLHWQPLQTAKPK